MSYLALSPIRLLQASTPSELSNGVVFTDRPAMCVALILIQVGFRALIAWAHGVL